MNGRPEKNRKYQKILSVTGTVSSICQIVKIGPCEYIVVNRAWPYGWEQLSTDQKERLVQALSVRERTTFSDSLLATALELTRDPRFLEIALKLALMVPEPLIAHDADIMWLDRAIQQSGNAKAKKIFDENWTFKEKWRLWDFQGSWKNEKPVIERVVKVIRKGLEK